MRSRSRSTSRTWTVTSSPTATTDAGVVDVLPGQLGHVDEAVHAAEVDEGAEVDDARHDALADLAGLEVGEELVALLLLGLLEPGPAGQHDVVAVLVELDDLGLERACRRTGCRSRTRRSSTSEAGRKPRRPMSRMRPPLTTSMTGPLTTPSRLLDLLDGAPGPLVLGPLLGEDQAALLVLLGEDEGLDLLAEADDLVTGRRRCGSTARASGDDALGLVSRCRAGPRPCRSSRRCR